MADAWDVGSAARHALAWPIRPWAARFGDLEDWPSIDELNGRLADAVGGHVTFVPSAPRRRRRRRAPIGSGDLYDGSIVLRREVPSRARSWHDFFNALAWAAWPRSKRALHERQHEAITERVRAPTLRLPAVRTHEQDRLAMLDEGGVVLRVSPGDAAALASAVRTGDEAPVLKALASGRADLLVFGHALFDHLRSEGMPLFVRPEIVATDGDGDDRATRLVQADVALADALRERRAPDLAPAAACALARMIESAS